MNLISPRWKKVLADLWANKLRTILVVASIGVGVFAVGWVISLYITIGYDMDKDYLAVNPSSGTMYTSLFDDEFLGTVRKIPGVANAEGRSSISGQVQDVTGNWMSIGITGIPPIKDLEINRIRPYESDSIPMLHEDEIYIEKTARARLPNLKAGDVIRIKLDERRYKNFRVAAVVHDVTAYSTMLSNSITGYVNMKTMADIGGYNEYSELYFTVKEKPKDEVHIKSVASLISKQVEKSGRTVYATVVYNPGEHPVKSVVQSMLILLGVLGGMALFLSAFLVLNTITALLSQHTRQIGIMKSVGATSGQIIGMYLTLVLFFGVLALMFAAPLAALASYGLIQFLSMALNFLPSGIQLPLPAFITQTIVALVVPVLAGAVPVMNGARITVREALSNYGVAVAGKQSWFDRLIEKVQSLPRPVLISIRNTFRRKGRLFLTLSTLSLAGAIFIGVFNVRASFMDALDTTLGYFLSDVNVSLGGLYRVEQVKGLMESVPGVIRAEPWGIEMAKVMSSDGITTTEIVMWAPPADSTLIKPVLISGRWLIPEDENGIVISNSFLDVYPEVKVGDMLTVKIGEKEYPWKVVGICQIAGTVIPPFTYVNYEYLNKSLHRVGKTSEYRLLTEQHDYLNQQRIVADLEEKFKPTGISISSMSTGAENQQQQQVSVNILITFLLVMAVLIAIVGGIGLAGTMSMNVLDRTREIGVMRSIGADNISILLIVIVEGMLIGAISWIIGIFLSVPISTVLGYLVGNSFLKTPLAFVFAMDGVIIWLIVIIILSTIASSLPARNASRLTIRDVLAYE